ncbi:hypothetical protein PN470_21315 [Microcystis sp. CS-574]|uniref:hypothetical protein n=1 Tax=Microcystis sp. CS-574 TaxID=3021718 RepID=UPI00232C565E|nr:hypothetical protein [Microcystis sp. CS-574]MDB9406765.1 hypothetical protein [Microcystis sp. CS-574]
MIILDTHIWLWWVDSSSRLTARLEQLILEHQVSQLRSHPKTQQDKIITNKSASNLYPLREKEPSRYDEPLEPADREYLKGISSMLSEWESEADECAYSDL